MCLCFRAFSSANKQTLKYIMNENTKKKKKNETKKTKKPV